MNIELTWYGHSTLGLKTGSHTLLVDPFFSGNPAASTTADQVSADFILVTHGHGDHVGDTVAIAKRTGALVIANFEICNWLSSQGRGQNPRAAPGRRLPASLWLPQADPCRARLGHAGRQLRRQPLRLSADHPGRQEDLPGRRYRPVWRYAPARRGRHRPGGPADRR